MPNRPPRMLRVPQNHSVHPGPTPLLKANGSRPWLFIGTPAHNNSWHIKFGTSVIRLFDAVYSLPPAQRFGVTLSTVSGGGVAKARNNIAWEFLEKTKATHLYFGDADTSFEPGQILRLMSHDVPLVGALYSHKRPQLQWSAKGIPDEVPDPKTGLQKVLSVGTGGFMIKREVLIEMREKFPIEYIEDWEDGKGTTRWDFFSEGVVQDAEYGYPNRTYLTEDWYFCYRARKLGYPLYVDAGCLIGHWEGMNKWPLPEMIPDMPSENPSPAESAGASTPTPNN